jgi:hypothetical protein
MTMYQRLPDFDEDLAKAKDPDLDENAFKELLIKHYGEIEIAQALAQNPACPQFLFTQFWRYMQPAAEGNPALEKYQANPYWHQNTQRSSRFKHHKYSSDISSRRPEIYRARFLMEHGDGGWRRAILAMENIPEQLIRDYVNSKSAPERKVIAARETAPQDIFAQLATDSAKTVREAMANNPHAPPDLIAQLATDKDPNVAAAARGNPNCPSDALMQARLQDATKPVVDDTGNLSFHKTCQLAGRSDISDTQVNMLVNHDEPCVRFLMGIHPATSAEHLAQLAEDSEKWVRASAAFNPNTPLSSLTTLLNSAHKDILIGLASNRSLPEAEQLQLAEKATERVGLTLANLTHYAAVWEKLAENVLPVKKASKKTWRHYLSDALAARKTGKFGGLLRNSNSRYLFVSRIAARSEKCPEDIACHLGYYIFEDYSQNPRVALALLEGKTPLAPQAYQEWKLDQWLSGGVAPGHVTSYYINSNDEKRHAQSVSAWNTELVYLLPVVLDPNTNTRKRLAQRNDLIRFVYEILVRDPKSGVRDAIANNGRAPKDLLAKLAGDKESTVSVAAARRSRGSATKGAHQSLVNAGSATERARLAKKESSAVILNELASDRAASVRTAVALNDKTPPEVIKELALKDTDVKVRMAAVKRLRDKDIIRQALNDTEKAVRVVAAEHSLWRTYRDKRYYYDEDFLALIATARDEELRGIAAKQTENENLHVQFIQDESLHVRRELGKNRFMSTDNKLVLARLTEDQDTLAALANKTTCEELFLIAASKITSSHADDPIRCHHDMLARPNVQDQLCTHPLMNIRFSLARQSNLTEHAASVLEQDPNSRIQEMMLRRKSA